MSNINPGLRFTAWEYVQQLEDTVTVLDKAVTNLAHHYAVSLKMEMEYRELLTRQLEHLLSKIEATSAVHRIEEVMS